MKYSVRLVYKGVEAYLSHNGKTSWKTLRIAKKHAQEMVNEGSADKAFVENEFGDILFNFEAVEFYS